MDKIVQKECFYKPLVREILDLVKTVVLVTDEKGKVVYINREGLKLLNCRNGDIIGKDGGKPLLAKKGEFHRERFFVWDFEVLRDIKGTNWGRVWTGRYMEKEKILERFVIGESFDKLRRVLEETVSALASTIEIRDLYTAGHQRRVARLSVALAREIGLDEKRIEGLRLASLTHDVGKIHIPAEILNKPAKLTDTELRMIREHPRMGYEILNKIEFPWPVDKIVLQHHERMDGSGYPAGISGEKILFESRILAVADVVEAMSSHRPYRPALGIEKALAEINQNRGKLYDSEVVKACTKLFWEEKFSFNPG